jgi:hypothetical protein
MRETLVFMKIFVIGGHLLRYPWSAISDWAWYRNFRYRTEESRIRHYIGYRNKLLSDIRYLTSKNSSISTVAEKTSVLGSNPADVINICWISDIGMVSDVDIGTLPISEWQYSVRHNFFRYRNNRCWWRMSDIADIEVYVDAHLWFLSTVKDIPR